MMLPTQDKDLPRAIEKIIVQYYGGDDYTMIMKILELIEKRGYRKDTRQRQIIKEIEQAGKIRAMMLKDVVTERIDHE